MNETRFIVTAVVAAVLVSCSKTEMTCGEEFRDEMTVTAVSSVATKSPLGGTVFPSGRNMVVSAYSVTTAEDYFTAIPFTYSEEKAAWRATPKQFWPFNGALDLLAYSCSGVDPLSVVWGEGNITNSVTLSMPDNSVIQDDYLVGQKTRATKTSASIVFSHPQNQICFTAASSVPYDAEGNAGISIESITLRDVYNAGTVKGLRTSEGKVAFEWQTLGAKKDVTFGPEDPVALGEEHISVSEGFLTPQQYATTMTVRYILHNGRDADGRVLDVPMEYTYTPQATLWQAGRKYRYAMNFSLEGVKVTASLIGWDDVSVPSDI